MRTIFFRCSLSCHNGTAVALLVNTTLRELVIGVALAWLLPFRAQLISCLEMCVATAAVADTIFPFQTDALFGLF